MKDARLKQLTISELLERFTAVAAAQFNAELYDEIAKYNRFYDDLVAIREELRKRPGDQRLALVSLFSHENPQVRLKAALYALAVAPAAAHLVLQEISDRNIYPQAADARQTLEAIERGDSKLT